jgi:hypothetical protein
MSYGYERNQSGAGKTDRKLWTTGFGTFAVNGYASDRDKRGTTVA